ncbi:MAG: hypothetical protein QNJ46_02115 [Leptolyngbyaceae cyanobacterium MO_188.B28]|nr:hypothetical protein [Leptolyngbyaceae cyanobacterium MO_188.B28]
MTFYRDSLNALTVLPHRALRRSVFLAMMGLLLTLGLAGCDTLVTDQYEATALVTYTWQVEYRPRRMSPDRPRTSRQEKFASASLLNRNGVQPEGAVTGPDDQGLWWPELPPRPTADELEARLQDREQFESPQLLKSTQYEITYEDNTGEFVTLPTKHALYRKAVRAYANGRSLKLTLGPNDGSIQKVELQ